MVEMICQWVIVVNLVGCFFVTVYRDFNGQPARRPPGFWGFLGTVLSMGLLAMVLYLAGAFDRLPGW